MGRISKQESLRRLGVELAEKMGKGFKAYPEETQAVIEYSPDHLQHSNVRVRYERPDFRGKLPIELTQLILDKAAAKYREESENDKTAPDKARMANEAYRKIKHLASKTIAAPVPKVIGNANQPPEAPPVSRELGSQLLEAVQDLTLELQALTEVLAKPKVYEMRQIIQTTPEPKE